MTGTDIHAFRVEFGITQAELAERLGVGRRMIISLEARDQTSPTWVGLALAALKAEMPPYVGRPLVLEQIKAKRHLRIRSSAGRTS